MLIGKLGLKTAFHKKGSSGQQVKFYSLSIEELTFAQSVLEYRQEQRVKREERKLQQQEENRLYQIMMETSYGLTTDSIFTPTQNTNISNKQQGVNMAESKIPSILDKLQPVMTLLEQTVALGLEVIQGFFAVMLGQTMLVKRLIQKLTDPMRFILSSSTEN